jgi:hypothetical protein
MNGEVPLAKRGPPFFRIAGAPAIRKNARVAELADAQDLGSCAPPYGPNDLGKCLGSRLGSDSGLRAVVAAWPRLPANVKRGILALVVDT